MGRSIFWVWWSWWSWWCPCGLPVFGYVRFLVSQWFVGGLLVVLVVAVVLVAWLRVVLVVVVTIVVVVVVVLEHSLGIYCWHTHAMLNAAAAIMERS